MARSRRRRGSPLRRFADAAARLPRRACAPRDPAVQSARHGQHRRLPCCGRSGRGCRSIAIGRPISRAAFPEKSAAEIEQILRGVWDNLGRVGAEFAHIDRLWDYDREHGRGRIMDSRRHRADRDPGSRRRQAGAGLRRASGELGARRGRRRTPTASTAPCSIAGPTCPPSPRPSSRCAPAAWGRWCRPAWTRRCKLAEALQRGSHVGDAGRSIRHARRAGDVLRPPDPRQSR